MKRHRLANWIGGGLLLVTLSLAQAPLSPPEPTIVPVNREDRIDPTQPGPEKEVIVGTAEEWEEKPQEGTRTLRGNVRIRRTDGYLFADLVTMYYDPDDPERRVVRTVAVGNVNLKEGEIVAACDRAEFRENNQVIDLTGNVVVLMGEDRLETEAFVYDRRTGWRKGSGGVRFRVRVESEETAPTPEAPEAPLAPQNQPTETETDANTAR